MFYSYKKTFPPNILREARLSGLQSACEENNEYFRDREEGANVFGEEKIDLDDEEIMGG